MTKAILLFITITLSSINFVQALDLRSNFGTVEFPTTGNTQAQRHFNHGIAALHSFWYPEALEAFQRSIIADPNFLMGYWGVAMAHNHPLWEDQDIKSARKALSKISRSAKLTHREWHYIKAVELLYGKGEKHLRDKAYSLAMQKIYHKYPKDLEAACFYSLSLLGLSRNTEGSLKLQIEAGAIALEVFQKNPNHPCAAHYTIHAFDKPELARLGLSSAKRYASIAPASHHAQHMPAHIFVQLGMWPEAATSNKNGWLTSLKWVEKKKLPISGNDYHSLQWLHYSYLQLGLLNKAESVFKTQLNDMQEGIQNKSNLRAGKYYHRMLAASVIETERWDWIEKFPPPEGWNPKTFPKSGYHFVRGFSSAMQGKIEEAKRHLSILNDLKEKGFRENYFKRIQNLDLWGLEIQTAITLFQKDFEKAIQLAKKATSIEIELPGPSGPPRILKPTYELLGEVFLKAGKPLRAQKEFSISLSRHPNRIRSLVGMARAAKTNGDTRIAMANYRQVVKQLKNSKVEIPELKEAKQFLKKKLKGREGV